MQKRALHAVGANFLWLAGERLLRIVLGLFILGYVARYLGKVQFGLLSYASSMTAIFAVIANAGIDGIVIRELVKYPEKKGEILGSAWGIKFFGAILIVVGFGVMAVVRRQSEFFVLAVVISLSMLPQSFEVIDLWFQKLVQSKFTVKAKTFAYIFSALTKILLIVFHAPLIFFCAALAMDVVFYALSLVLVYSRTGETLQSWRFRLPVARELLRDGWPLIISGVVVALFIRIEQIFVMKWLGEDVAGTYYAALKINDVWNMLPALLLPSLYPLLVQTREKQGGRYTERLQDVFDVLTALGFAVAIGTTIAAPFLIPLIYGPKYADAVPILIIQAWAAPFTFSGAVRAQYFLMERLTLYHTWSALIGIVVNVALAITLIPRWGAPGAACGALLGYAVSAYLTSLIFGKLRACGKFQSKAFLAPFRIHTLLSHVQKAL